MILTGLSSTLVQSLQVVIVKFLYLLSHAHARYSNAYQLHLMSVGASSHPYVSAHLHDVQWV